MEDANFSIRSAQRSADDSQPPTRSADTTVTMHHAHWHCRKIAFDCLIFQADSPFEVISVEVLSGSDYAPTFALWRLGGKTFYVVKAADA